MSQLEKMQLPHLYVRSLEGYWWLLNSGSESIFGYFFNANKDADLPKMRAGIEFMNYDLIGLTRADESRI